jgi:hypothetical protein
LLEELFDPINKLAAADLILFPHDLFLIQGR